jgi:hypothetical protein
VHQGGQMGGMNAIRQSPQVIHGGTNVSAPQGVSRPGQHHAGHVTSVTAGHPGSLLAGHSDHLGNQGFNYNHLNGNHPQFHGNGNNGNWNHSNWNHSNWNHGNNHNNYHYNYYGEG